jgi:competence protein ComEC
LEILVIALIFSLISKKKNFLFLVFCFFFLSLGIFRHQSFLLRAENNELKDYIGKEYIVLVGIVDSQPSLGEKSTKLRIQLENFKAKILVTCWKYPQYKYGDKLKITGNLEEPQSFEGFNYKDYLAKDGIYGLMYLPEIELIDRGFGNPILTSLFSLKDKLKQAVGKILPSPQSGLLEALFFGDEENIPEIWKEKFNLTGTRHITAVSGMNITIISFLILNFLLYLGFWRSQAFYFSIIFILFYVLVIGAPSSAVRAAIMGIIFLAAQHFGRLSNALRAIVFSGSLMLFLNPLLLKIDIGFQLSFLAILGLVYLQPIFLDLLKKIPDVLEVRYTLSATLAAQFFTLPILIYNFGQIPLVGPLSNIFIVPLLSLITILGFVLAFLGAIYLPLAKIISFPLWIVLTYILKIIDFSSKIPYATVPFKNVSFVWLLIFYLILGFLVWKLQEKQKLKFLQ